MGYQVNRSAGLIAAGGIIAPVIPPSIGLIIFGVAGNVSITKLFLAGIVPGILMGLAIGITWWWVARRENVQPAPKVGMAERLKITAEGGFALALPVLILGGMKFGVCSQKLCNYQSRIIQGFPGHQCVHFLDDGRQIFQIPFGAIGRGQAGRGGFDNRPVFVELLEIMHSTAEKLDEFVMRHMGGLHDDPAGGTALALNKAFALENPQRFAECRS